MQIRTISLSGSSLKVQVKKMNEGEERRRARWRLLGEPQDYATFPPTSGWEGEGEGLGAAGQPPAVTDSKPDSLMGLLHTTFPLTSGWEGEG